MTYGLVEIVDVGDVLGQAWRAVEASGVPAELYRDAFLEAVRLLTVEQQGNGVPDADRVAQSNRGQDTPAAKKAPRKVAASTNRAPTNLQGDVTLDENAFLSKLCEESEVPVEKLERVFHLDKGTVRISLSRSKLGPSAKVRMETVGQLISTARALVLLEDGTPLPLLREEAQRLGTLDRNINRYLEGLDGFSYVGGRNDKRLKARTAAEKAFPALIDRVLGESSAEGD